MGSKGSCVSDFASGSTWDYSEHRCRCCVNPGPMIPPNINSCRKEKYSRLHTGGWFHQKNKDSSSFCPPPFQSQSLGNQPAMNPNMSCSTLSAAAGLDVKPSLFNAPHNQSDISTEQIRNILRCGEVEDGFRVRWQWHDCVWSDANTSPADCFLTEYEFIRILQYTIPTNQCQVGSCILECACYVRSEQKGVVDYPFDRFEADCDPVKSVSKGVP